MNPERAHERPPAPQNSRAPDFLAHWVVKTTRTEQMIAWYREVFGGRVIHQGKRIAFIAWDDEHHRIALIKVPRLLRVAFPLARFRRKLYGIDHIAVQFESVERLLVNYERLRRSGISPVWSINHGPTTSLYYEDPDGIRLEFQTDNFPTVATTAAYFESGAFVANPIGTEIDPDYLLKRLRNGDDPADLLKPGAGTPPGTKARANKRAITWKTL